MRLYGVLVFIVFGSLMVGFAVQTPLLEYGGRLSWVIWNGIRCGDEPCHVPPMLFRSISYGGVFFFRAARRPLTYVSFLNFTMWAKFFDALLMGVQTTMMMDRQWHRWFTEIPFIGLISVGIYLWRPTAEQDASWDNPLGTSSQCRHGGREHVDAATKQERNHLRSWRCGRQRSR